MKIVALIGKRFSLVRCKSGKQTIASCARVSVSKRRVLFMLSGSAVDGKQNNGCALLHY